MKAGSSGMLLATIHLMQRRGVGNYSASKAAWYHLALLSLHCFAVQAQHVLDDSHKFVTRPDIEAPRWHITVHEPDLVSPGYWFVDSYDFLDQSTRIGGHWTAPHIFDGQGELIWSGAYLSEQYDTFDFKVSNILGEDMLTFLYPRNGTAIVLNKHFEIHKIIQVSSRHVALFNMHDLHFVDDGKRMLYFYDEVKKLSDDRSEGIGFKGGNCPIRENSFQERDLTNDWEVDFNWASSEHVDMKESSFLENGVDARCTQRPLGWDFIHANALDRFPDDGSYLLSARHTDTIYKIDPNGTITWRLGGIESDFEADFGFAKQHHSRILEHNNTHTIISFLDNADSEEHRPPHSDYSRGLIVALRTDTQPMTATIVQEYPHPFGKGAYLLGRGSTQVLPNKNVFSCWVHACLQTEHTPDGKLIMEAHVKQGWLKSYRSYKFPFVGLPSQPPDVYAKTQGQNASDVKTLVWVSWNGATEVATWNLYKTDEEGQLGSRGPVTSSARTGFETSFTIDGYATYVVLEAKDKHGNVLSKSNVFKTLKESPLSNEVLAEEANWLENFDKHMESSWTAQMTICVAGVTCLVILAAVTTWTIWLRRRWPFSKRHHGPEYELVANENPDSFAIGEDDDGDMDKSHKP